VTLASLGADAIRNRTSGTPTRRAADTNRTGTNKKSPDPGQWKARARSRTRP